MEFRVLGPLDVRDDAGRPLVANRRKQRTALVALLLRPNRVVHTGTLVRDIWPHRVPASALSNLQSYLAGWRAMLGGNRLSSHPGGYRLRVGADELDAWRFERLARRGREALAAHDPGRALTELTAALALWRGPVLEDVNPPVDLVSEVTRLSELSLGCLEDRFAAALALGQHEDVVADLAEATECNVLRNRLWELRLIALYRSGRRADALAAYRQAHRLMADAGARPDPALRLLHQRVLAADPALDAPRGPVSAVVPQQLPADDGTEVDGGAVAALAKATGRPGAVIALTGAAGVGKTAAVVRWARATASRFPDGRLFVDLGGAALRSPVHPHAVLTRLLAAFGVPAHQVPADVDAAAALYRSVLADRQVLLVLDDAASTEQVRPLLPGVFRGTVVITSRAGLDGLVALQDVVRLSPREWLCRSA